MERKQDFQIVADLKFAIKKDGSLFEEEVCYFADIGISRKNFRLPNVSSWTNFITEVESCPWAR